MKYIPRYGDGIFTLPFSPLLESVQAYVKEHTYFPDLLLFVKKNRKVTEHDAGNNTLGKDEYPNLDFRVADLIVKQAIKMTVECPACGKSYSEKDIGMQFWSEGDTRSGSSGRKWVCPQKHVLLLVVDKMT
jgi:hypothetical protein